MGKVKVGRRERVSASSSIYFLNIEYIANIVNMKTSLFLLSKEGMARNESP